MNKNILFNILKDLTVKDREILDYIANQQGSVPVEQINQMNQNDNSTNNQRLLKLVKLNLLDRMKQEKGTYYYFLPSTISRQLILNALAKLNANPAPKQLTLNYQSCWDSKKDLDKMRQEINQLKQEINELKHQSYFVTLLPAAWFNQNQ